MTTPAMGHLSKNFVAQNREEPAIIVNPAASPVDVLAWCWGEVESLRQVAATCDETGMDGEAIGAVFLHRLVPLSGVLSDVIQGLWAEQKRRQEAQQQGRA